MIKILPIPLLLLLSMGACSDTEQVEETKDISNKSEVIIDKQLPAKSNTTKEKVLKQLESIKQNKINSLNQSRSIAINGEKFSTTARPVVQGTAVYNLLMRKTGKIKGTFVVVLTKEKELPTQIKESFTVENLAQSTFRLAPKDRKVLDMMQEYKNLMQENFVRLEMEIDYSPISKQQEF